MSSTLSTYISTQLLYYTHKHAQSMFTFFLPLEVAVFFYLLLPVSIWWNFFLFRKHVYKFTSVSYTVNDEVWQDSSLVNCPSK